MEHPWQPDPAYHQHVPPPIPQPLPDPIRDWMETATLQSILKTLDPLPVTAPPHIKATTFYTKILTLTWTNVLNLWTACNEDHHTETICFPPKMLFNLNGIYATQDKLPTHTQNRIFHLTKEELLTKSKSYIKNWIQHSSTYIHNKLKTIAQQNWLNTQDIQTFFNPV